VAGAMPVPTNALALLKAEHDNIKRLLRAFDALGLADDGDGDVDALKAALIDDICYELTIHALIEQEIFYPAPPAPPGLRPH
jgi:hypothetical protein